MMIRMSVLMVTLVLFVVGCGPSSRSNSGNDDATGSTAESGAGKSTASQPVDFTYTLPERWTKVPPGGDAVAINALDVNAEGYDRGAINIDVTDQHAPTSEAAAKQMALLLKGTVDAEPFILDGVNGVGITIADAEVASPRKVVIVYHNDKMYRIMARGFVASEVETGLLALQRSWKWK